jgi:hypothetical protein
VGGPGGCGSTGIGSGRRFSGCIGGLGGRANVDSRATYNGAASAQVGAVLDSTDIDGSPVSRDRGWNSDGLDNCDRSGGG